MNRSAVRFSALVFCLGLWSQAGKAADAREIASQWIAAGAKVRSIEADFIQERQLKALKKPLASAGKIWQRQPGSFRWQIGEPPAIIAVRSNGGDLRVAGMREKKLTVWPQAALAAEADARGGSGLAMMAASFPADIAAFEQAFEIRSAIETSEKGVWELRLGLRDRRARLAVQDIIFTIVPADGSLRQLEMRMRDGSATITRITAVKRDAEIPDSVFVIDPAGFTVEQGRGS